jgi:hypothetical protein
MEADLIASSPLAWIVINKMITENQKPLEFHNHRFMIDIYADNAPDIVCIKSAQVGFSVFSILKSFHELKFEKRNIIYALPTKNVVQDFVVPKVNPLITSNPIIAKEMGSDSVSLKKLGDRFIYFKGGSEREAIAVSADTLVVDELDRMPSQDIVTMFDSRLQAADEPRRRRFSNPSAKGFGIDGLWQDSCQFHWMVTCTACGHISYMDYNRETYLVGSREVSSHYIDKIREIYACGGCDKEITNEARRMGKWIARHPRNTRHGYWISQMMAPWVTAKRIIEQESEMDILTFHGFVLGKAYTPSDMDVDREAILRATAPSNIARNQVALGVDQDAGGQYYAAMTTEGIFAHGYVDSWDKIEHLKLMYNALVVSDPNPYDAIPKQMAGKYSDWYLCYFKKLETLSPIQWKDKEQVVYADRTRVIDIRANEIVHGRMLYRERPHELEDVIKHWSNIYRTTVEEDDGRIKSVWMKKEGKQSDYPFAEVYARIGLSQLLGGLSEFVEPLRGPESQVTNLTTDDGKKINIDFTDIIEETYSEMSD